MGVKRLMLCECPKCNRFYSRGEVDLNKEPYKRVCEECMSQKKGTYLKWSV